MKNLFLLLILLSSATYASTISPPNSMAWSLYYGYGKNTNDRGFTPSGAAYKLSLGGTIQRAEFAFGIKYLNQDDKVTYSNINATINHRDIAPEFTLGVWVFSRLKIHAGYSRHYIVETVRGTTSSTQTTQITNQYQVKSPNTGGILGGADLVLIQNPIMQLFVNYDYYHLNAQNANEWEAMVGLRFYIGASSGGQNLFSKLFSSFSSGSSK